MSLPWPNLTTEQWRERLNLPPPKKSLKDWDESKHPRGGNPKNPGEFSSTSAQSDEDALQHGAALDSLDFTIRVNKLAEQNGFPRKRMIVAEPGEDLKAQLKAEGMNPARIRAYFDPVTGFIVVNPKIHMLPDEQLEQTIKHEIGHAKLFTAEQANRTRYDALIDADKNDLARVGTALGAYSKQWWDRAYLSAPADGFDVEREAFRTAVDETFAECHRIGAYPGPYAKLRDFVKAHPE